MLTEHLISTYLFSLLGFLAGCLLVKVICRKQLSQLQEQSRLTELNYQKTLTELAAVKERKGELEDQADALNDSLGFLSEAKNKIEREKHINTARLFEIENQKGELNEQIQRLQKEIQALAAKLDAEKLGNSELSQELRQAEVTAEAAEKQLLEAKAVIGVKEEKLEKLQAAHAALLVDYHELKTSLHEREAAFSQQLSQFDEQKQALSKEFENLANRIFEQKGKRFVESSEQSIGNLLKPFREQIDGFQSRINEVHKESVEGSATLQAQIKSVMDAGLKMRDEASNLTNALKGDKKAQGTWSEVQAELLLEMAGLQQGQEYLREANYKTEDGNNQRPDFVVNLPNGKHLLIDSKVSLNSYVAAVSAKTDAEYDQHIKAHVNALRRHARQLSARNYTALKGVNSPEYIFMFVGNEPAYIAAFRQQPNLFEEAYNKGVAIVTSSTLLSSLKIVSHLWSLDKQNRNTRALADHAAKIYEKFRVFVIKMEKLGSQINTVQRSYQESWTTLKDGNGSLNRQVSKLVDMGVTVKEKLPDSNNENTGADLVKPAADSLDLAQI